MFVQQKLGIVLSLSLCAAGFALSASAQGSSAGGGKRTLIKAGHVLDVKTGKLADAQTIVVVGDAIQSIGPTASVAGQTGDTIVDLSRMTVLPGLIDVHTHLTMNTDFDPYRELTTTDAKEAINGVVNAHVTLIRFTCATWAQTITPTLTVATPSMPARFRDRTCW
jgi:imidazolonepropionase-like amidohydrolase